MNHALTRRPLWFAMASLLLIFGLLRVSVQAAPALDLYSATVGVVDQSAESREAGVQEALVAVLVKITGHDSGWVRRKAVAVLSRGSDFLAQYSYRSGEAPDELLLDVAFDPQSLESALRNSGVPVWGRERPEVLVWSAYRDRTTGNQGLVTPGDPIGTALQRAANTRGLPVTLPAMDRDDRQAVSFGDVWGGFERELLRGSARYGSPAVLLSARITSNENGTAQTSWNMIENGVIKDRWTTEGATLDAALVQGIGQVTERYASRLAVADEPRDGGAGFTRLSVRNVRDLAAYASVTKYLGSLSAVEQLEVETVGGDELRLRLKLRGSLLQLQEAIRLNNLLRKTGAPVSVVGLDGPNPVGAPVGEPLGEGVIPETGLPGPIMPRRMDSSMLHYQYLGTGS